MAAVIYIKQTNEPLIPVTVRVNWLPNGKIKPLMYWTPDDSCYEVKHVYESTPLIYLRERGEGIRIKVKAEIAEASKYTRYARHETYIYSSDKRFCEKGFIDSRYGHAGKEYVPVTMDIYPNGDYKLIYFMVNGSRYLVEKTLDIEPRGSFLAGGIGFWHKVEARLVNTDNNDDLDPDKSVRRLAALFLELNKWFVAINSM